MKTTVELSDALLRAAKKLAVEEGTTLRVLIERALSDLIKSRRRTRAFSLRDASVGGKGISPQYRDAGWEEIRDAAYEGRGA